MSIDNCLILAAGLGTRMGEIGKFLPKVLWPVFNKTLLELQIAYAKQLGCRRIFINLHHCQEKILSFLEEKNDPAVIPLVETELLDIGGAIHNVASQLDVQQSTPLLILNGDQFLFFENSFWQRVLKDIQNFDAILFSITVDQSSGYNQTVVQNGLLTDIIPAASVKESSYFTYSGVSVIDLASLKLTPGPSKFFDTVADYKNKKIAVLGVENSEYWDFGCTERYFSSMFKLLIEGKNISSDSQFVAFCLNNNVLSKEHLSGDSLLINLSAQRLGNSQNEPVIILSSDQPISFQGPGIYYNSFYLPVDKALAACS